MNNFVKLTLNPTGDPIYIAVDKIVSVNVSQPGDSYKGTFVGVARENHPFFMVKESPDSVMNLIRNLGNSVNVNHTVSGDFDPDKEICTLIVHGESIPVHIGEQTVMQPVGGGKAKRKFEVLEV